MQTEIEPKEALRRRRSLCLKIACELSKHFDLKRTEWDEDEAAQIVENAIPLDLLSAEGYYLEQQKYDTEHPPKKTKPNIQERLRNALDLPKDSKFTIIQLIESAIDRLNDMKDDGK